MISNISPERNILLEQLINEILARMATDLQSTVKPADSDFDTHGGKFPPPIPAVLNNNFNAEVP